MTTSETAYREFRDQLSRYVAKRLGNPADIEEVLQDVFLRVVRNEAALGKARAPLAWLYTVARSVLIDHYRKQGRTPRARTGTTGETVAVTMLPAAMEPAAREPAAREPGPAADGFDRCLAPLIEKLPDKYREAVIVVDMEGRRQSELAQRIGLGLPAAKSRVQRGRRLLKEAILSCCRLELDSLSRIIALEPDCGQNERCC